MRTFQVEADEAGLRLDQWLAGRMGADASRTVVRRWIDTGCVVGPGQLAASRRVLSGERYELTIPTPAPSHLEPVAVEFPVVYEDDDLAVIHKPPGIAVHPGPRDVQITLSHGILHRWGQLPDPGAADADREPGVSRPGIVHRLDRETEGLLLVAKQERAHRILSKQFETRTVEKEYVAWVIGAPPAPRGRIELALRRHPKLRLKMRVDPGGRMAITEYAVEEALNTAKGRKFCRLSLTIQTGRTHQIRVHMAHVGCPVVGDPLYSHQPALFERFGMLLFARRLAFTHPRTGETLAFRLELPARFQDFAGHCHHL